MKEKEKAAFQNSQRSVATTDTLISCLKISNFSIWNNSIWKKEEKEKKSHFEKSQKKKKKKLILNLRVLTNLFSAKGNNQGTRDSSAHSYREQTTSAAQSRAVPSLSSFWGKVADVLQEGTHHYAQKMSLCLGVLTKDGRVVLFQMFYMEQEMRTKARAIFWFIYYKEKANINKTE